jgi:hypothetical protein
VLENAQIVLIANLLLVAVIGLTELEESASYK